MVTGHGTLRRRSVRRLATAALAAGVLSAFGAAGVGTAEAGAATRSLGAAASTVWLCRPGQAGDPCALSPAVTTVTAQGTTSVSTPAPAPASHAFDCFYVYPTVSTEQGDNANLAVQPAEIDAAAAQASQFSQVCNVWAPMYRQVTKVGAAERRGLLPSVRDRLRQPAGRVEGLSRPRQPWPADRLHRALAGRRHADQVAARAGRPLGEPAQADGVRHPPRGQRAGARGQTTSAGASGTSRRASPPRRRGASSPIRASASPPPADSLFGRPGQGVSLLSGQTRQGRPAGGVRQPGDVLRTAGPPAAPLPAGDLPGAAPSR